MFVDQSVKLAMLMVLPFLLLSCGISSIHCSTISKNTTDVLWLSLFRGAITGDPKGSLSSWNTTTPYCQWNGVKCSLRHPGRVTVLDLGDQDLSGLISPSLGNLTFLKRLNLSKNTFSGELPPLNGLQRLEILDVSTNALHGSIPDELWQLPNINALFLRENMLSGSISSALSNRSSLRFLDLNSNMLGSELPANIGNILHALIGLDLHNNMFEGPIPVSLGNASGLEVVTLSNNRFTGQIPSSFGKLLRLEYLILQKNKLEAKDTQSWGFLEALSNCKQLKTLDLSQNHLQGTIPNSIGKFSSSLETIMLGTNSLSGTVPTSIANLTGLLRLELNNNSLTGSIGEWVGNMKNLHGLILEVNNFNGSIPSSIGNLVRLEYLYLAKNNFEGPIPLSLVNLPQLSELNLSYNNLQGNLPTQLSSTITKYLISYNNIVGPIPPVIGNLNHLTELHLSSNKLDGTIPDSLSGCEQLEIVQLDQNFLTGNIPVSLSSLSNLIMLNLSHNNLSGSIPVALCDLKFLTQLDLSYNHLYGNIPRNGVFENASAVSLGENSGLCGGIVDLKMPSCPHVYRRRLTQYYLIRVLIPVFGFMSVILLIYFVLAEKKAREPHLLPPFAGEQFLKVSYKDLAQATQDFSKSNLIGRGSYGSVYRGKILESKLEVAVKVLDLDMRGAEKSFFSECEALRRIQHRNLVPIITACNTVDSTGNVFKALVYEYMPNGNLDTWLHNNLEAKTPKYLSLIQRINIAINIADALVYLHHDSGKLIIHCDVKPSNILLDDDMTAHLGDFGIASFYLDSQLRSTDSTSSAGVKGTIGYIAPGIATSSRTFFFWYVRSNCFFFFT